VQKLNKQLRERSKLIDIHIFFVDDGSTEPIPSLDRFPKMDISVQILPLGVNVGHQRAIIAGLRYLANSNFDHVLVMDSDGEDTTEGVVLLLEKSLGTPSSVIVAQRGIRSESFWFKFFYKVHKLIFRALIGKTLDFGNFMIMPNKVIEKLTSSADSSSHLPSSVLKSGLPLERVRVDRGSRYFGVSKMSLEKLISHSFASLAVFSDKIMIRLTIVSVAGTLVLAVAIVCVILLRVFTESTTPGWATAAVGILLIICFQVLSFVGLGTLITLNLSSIKSAFRAQEEKANIKILGKRE
jgi:glycosyltransferase involved in cell wall biosynthesis